LFSGEIHKKSGKNLSYNLEIIHKIRNGGIIFVRSILNDEDEHSDEMKTSSHPVENNT